MELCSGGGILDRMKQRTLTEARIATIIRSVLRFIAQCHAKGIIYRDVKPDNFLFLTEDDDSPIRATDFGLSIRCDMCPIQPETFLFLRTGEKSPIWATDFDLSIRYIP